MFQTINNCFIARKALGLTLLTKLLEKEKPTGILRLLTKADKAPRGADQGPGASDVLQKFLRAHPMDHFT